MTTHNLRVSGKVIRGNKIPAQVALKVEAYKLKIYLTEECVAEPTPNVELVQSISKFCGVQDATHQLLLNIALGNKDLEQIRRAYVQYGLHVKLPSGPKGTYDIGLKIFLTDPFFYRKRKQEVRREFV